MNEPDKNSPYNNNKIINKNRINTSAHKALGFRLAIQGDSDFIIQSINHNGFSNFSM